MAKRQADLQVRVQLQKNQFLQQEATIYHNVYQEILQATEYYCKQNNIDMVYKFSGDPVDVNRPDSVLNFINKPVVWYQKSLDITPAILQELNRTAIDPRAAQPAQRPGVPVQQVTCATVRPGAGHGWPAPRREGFFHLVTDDGHLWMYATRKQQTIAAPVTTEGVGYWSGEDVRVEFCPAPVDTGIVFVRADLPGAPRIPATVQHRVEMPRRTTLRCGEAGVEMVEHVMAALAGLQIDNCEVWVDRPEMPGCDGSCLPFVEALRAAGVMPQEGLRPWQRDLADDSPGRRRKLD